MIGLRISILDMVVTLRTSSIAKLHLERSLYLYLMSGMALCIARVLAFFWTHLNKKIEIALNLMGWSEQTHQNKDIELR